MKKYIVYILIAIIFSACENILEEVPKNFMAPENYYKNEKDALGAIAATYSQVWIGNEWFNYPRLFTDWSIARGSFASVANWDKVIAADQQARIRNNWNAHYRGINRANIVLNRIPQIEGLNENIKTRLLAEAHFLRAWFYYNLIDMWGPVPLRDEEFTGNSEIHVPRAPINEIYDLILNDLTIAEKDLPESVGDETKRATKWAAKMLLARVYLNQEEWGKAATKANEVIESNTFTLISVEEPDDYYKIFATSTTHSEDIWSHHFSVNTQPQFMQWYLGAGTQYNRGNVWGFTNLPNMNAPLIRNWNDNDLRKGFNLFDRHVNLAGDTVMNDAETLWRFKKYIKDPNGYALYNVPIFRYTEAFLIFAEASTRETGSPTALALERLNIIKRRAYGYDLFSPSPADYSSGMSLNEFIDTIIQERAYEFFFEDLRWWDLRRTGKIADVILEAHGKTFNSNRLLFPIPDTEIETNEAITVDDQNPGY
jgi:starch-binding outer membrane protein, SusD/RagB family